MDQQAQLVPEFARTGGPGAGLRDEEAEAQNLGDAVRIGCGEGAVAAVNAACGDAATGKWDQGRALVNLWLGGGAGDVGRR